jgi:hypothetical protein
MLSFITIPETFVADVSAYSTQLFTDLNLLIMLAIGLPLGFWIIRKVISLVRTR